MAQADHVVGRRSDAAAAPEVVGDVVVIAAGRHERGRRHRGPHLEAEAVAVEAGCGVEIPDVQVDVSHAQPAGGKRAGRLALDRREQRADVKRLRAVGDELGAAEVGPALARAVGRELESDPVGVGQIDRLVGAVV